MRRLDYRNPDQGPMGIMPGQPDQPAGLYGMSGNLDDRRSQGNPYGDLKWAEMAADFPSLAQSATSPATNAPTYQPMNQFNPNMIPTGRALPASPVVMAQFGPSGMGMGGTVMSQNQRPDPNWFQPNPTPPPVQSMGPFQNQQAAPIPMQLGMGQYR